MSSVKTRGGRGRRRKIKTLFSVHKRTMQLKLTCKMFHGSVTARHELDVECSPRSSRIEGPTDYTVRIFIKLFTRGWLRWFDLSKDGENWKSSNKECLEHDADEIKD